MGKHTAPTNPPYGLLAGMLGVTATLGVLTGLSLDKPATRPTVEHDVEWVGQPATETSEAHLLSSPKFPALPPPPSGASARRTGTSDVQPVRRGTPGVAAVANPSGELPALSARTAAHAPQVAQPSAADEDYRTELYRYREPATPDGHERDRAVLRCQQQARHVPAGEVKSYGELARGSLEIALKWCVATYGG